MSERINVHECQQPFYPLPFFFLSLNPKPLFALLEVDKCSAVDLVKLAHSLTLSLVMLGSFGVQSLSKMDVIYNMTIVFLLAISIPCQGDSDRCTSKANQYLRSDVYSRLQTPTGSYDLKLVMNDDVGESLTENIIPWSRCRHGITEEVIHF